MSAKSSASFNFRLPEHLKAEAFNVIEEYGFTPSQAMILFLTEIVKTKTIPLNLSYLKPNETTLRSMQAAEKGEFDIISVSENETVVDALMRHSVSKG